MGNIQADIAVESWLFEFWVFIKLRYATSLMHKFC